MRAHGAGVRRCCPRRGRRALYGLRHVVQRVERRQFEPGAAVVGPGAHVERTAGAAGPRVLRLRPGHHGRVEVDIACWRWWWRWWWQVKSWWRAAEATASLRAASAALKGRSVGASRAVGATRRAHGALCSSRGGRRLSQAAGTARGRRRRLAHRRALKRAERAGGQLGHRLARRRARLRRRLRRGALAVVAARQAVVAVDPHECCAVHAQ